MTQTGFRRIGMIPSAATTKDNITTTGVKTVHISFMTDTAKPLNRSHEYQVAWLESADYSTNQFDIKMGTILGQEANGGDNIVIQGNQNGKPSGKVQNLFVAPLTNSIWHNFAFTLDFDKK